MEGAGSKDELHVSDTNFFLYVVSVRLMTYRVQGRVYHDCHSHCKDLYISKRGILTVIQVQTVRSNKAPVDRHQAHCTKSLSSVRVEMLKFYN
jgi:hypothetical protein